MSLVFSDSESAGLVTNTGSSARRTETTAQSQNQPNLGSPPEYTDEDAESLFGVPPPVPDRATLQKLPLPVAVPQIRVAYDASFVRAYSPELVRSGVTQNDWLKFVDGLNIAMVLSRIPKRFISYHLT